MTFIPTPLATPVVVPSNYAGDATRQVAYISTSEYRFAPTAIDTTNLVQGGAPSDQTAALADVIARASGWVDEFCFHRGDGTLAASITTDADYFLPKNDGSIGIICNFKPVISLVGLGLGPGPANQTSIDSNTAGGISIDGKIIWLPGAALYNGSVAPWFGGYPTGPNGRVYVTWQYVNGFPHMALAENATAGATTIQITPAVAGETAPSGVFGNTQLTIHDGTNTETVTVAATPTGNTLTLTSGLQYAHTVPIAPDLIRVSAIPRGIEQAVVSITSCLVKTRGTRALVLPTVPGAATPRQALAQAGALEDFEIACRLLKPYQTVYMR